MKTKTVEKLCGKKIYDYDTERFSRRVRKRKVAR